MSNETTVEEATHANRLGYSDIEPFEIVEKRTPRKLMVRCMDAELDPEWKMDVTVGGFAGHVNNNRTQKYSYSSNEEYELRAIRLNKRGEWHDKYGHRYSLNTVPHKFYDYNF